MKISFITLFPEYFEAFKKHSIISKSIKNELISIEIIDIRDYAKDKHKKVDDYIYGGGKGMLILIEPVVEAIESVKTDKSFTIFLGPKGKRFNQNKAKEFSNYFFTKKIDHLILISGHYEGIDSRIKYFIDEEISIGDFILTGGELPSMVLADSIIRLLPSVLGKEVIEQETFENNHLEYDQYSKPIDFRGKKVPDVLLSGDHNKIILWKKKNAINNTIDYLIRKGNSDGN